MKSVIMETGKPAAEAVCSRHGYNRQHPAVVREARYSLWGWFLLSFGVTAIPKRIDYRCSECGELFAMSVDPVDLQREAP